MVIGSDYIGSNKSNYNTITITIVPALLMMSDEMSIHIVLQIAVIILVSMVTVIAVRLDTTVPVPVVIQASIVIHVSE